MSGQRIVGAVAVCQVDREKAIHSNDFYEAVASCFLSGEPTTVQEEVVSPDDRVTEDESHKRAG